MSRAGLWDELSAARSDLAAIGLPRPRLFAYPYGEHDARVRMMVKKAGYDAAFTLLTRRAFPTAQDRYALPRIEVGRQTRVDALVETARRPQVYRRPDLERELGGALRRVIPAQRTIRGRAGDHEARSAG
ncbi:MULTISPECIES: polysaccharide deacetylase family protein [unclassified Frankia]